MGKVALVTGGAVRVGRAISLGLAEAGYDVVVNYRSSRGPAVDVEHRIAEMGRRAHLLPGDVSDPAEVERMAREVEGHLDRLDLLVNSASVFRSRKLLDVSTDEWDQVMAVNLRAPFLLVRELAPLLLEAEGSVVNIVDLSAFQPWVDFPDHSVSKAGLLHLTRVMARALAPRVRVNAVAPGNVLPPPDHEDEDRKAWRDRVPLGRLGSPEDVVRTVLFLARSPYITGEVVVVDGGERLQGRG